jgi:hypothetical protein
MRHTFATLALAAGALIEWISKQMGHTSIRTTLKYYARFLPVADARAVAALDAFESGAADQPVRIQTNEQIRRRNRLTRNRQFPGGSKAGATGLEPATSGVTGRRSNQLNYAPEGRSVYLASQRSEDASSLRASDQS